MAADRSWVTVTVGVRAPENHDADLTATFAPSGSTQLSGCRAASLVIAVDASKPVATLSAPATVTGAFDVKIAFDEAVTGFCASDVTLTFAPGETSRTVAVAVLDDAIDEGEETFTLSLRYASGAEIADGTAPDMIENTDAMPKAWLARFGRTVVEQVVDAVEGAHAWACMFLELPAFLCSARRRGPRRCLRHPHHLAPARRPGRRGIYRAPPTRPVSQVRTR